MNPTYQLTLEAESDLIAIWLHGERRWGEAQADRYQDELHADCRKIAEGTALGRPFEKRSDISFYHSNSHYLFFTRHEDRVIVIAVLHDRMDLPRRLAERLSAI